MTDEKSEYSEIPDQCRICALEGMEAVRCLVYPTLKPPVDSLVQYMQVGDEKDRIIKSGGKFNHWRKEKKRFDVKRASIPGKKV